ncbi:MAG TPA: IS110 family transposase [Thermoanaerobaculia bacterium]|nr:IS110 family transposase [Thermoanaerobaculia bacterium]
MDVVYERCAGIDVHKEFLYICVLIGPGRGQKFKFKFGTFPHELIQLRQKLVELRVTHVLMESTGVYWMPVYDALEGFMEIVVGNAQHIMHVPGRKTDETDAEWMVKLLRCGLVKPSFVPPRPFRELRQLTRYRRAVVQARASEQNRVEKHLQIAGVKLSSVASCVFGVSGANMLKHIGEGKTDPTELAELALGRLRKKIPQLKNAFAGSISEHTQQLISMQMDQMNRLECTIAEVELKIDQKVSPYAEILARLDEIPGIDDRTAMDILAETGIDMSPWPTHRQFAAMAGLCPGNYISAGKRLKNRSRQGNPYLKSTMVQAAASAINKDGSYFQSKFKRLKQRRGHKRALVAIAHAMFVAIYHMIKNGAPYRELGADYVTQHENGSKKNDLVKQLEKMGYAVSLTETA